MGGAALLPPLGSHCIVGETSYMTWRVNIVDEMVAQRLAGDVSLLSGL